MDKESFFISHFQNKYIGDDGAIVEKYIYTKDAFFENVHFKTKWLSHYEIGKKAMLVNISDAVSMNAKPKYALLSVAMPKNITKKQMRDLALGLLNTAKKWRIEIIGGDTISNTKLDITITLISIAKKPLKRKGLKANHLIAYTGTLGDSRKGLKTLLNLGKISKYSRFKNITLKEKFIQKSARFLSAGMDISDGLGSDLGKLSKINKLGFNFKTKLSKNTTCSGEEYEMLIGFDKRYKKAIFRIAKQTRTPLHVIAKATRKKYKNPCKAHHF